MKKILLTTGILLFSFLLSFGQDTLRVTNGAATGTGSLNEAIQGWADIRWPILIEIDELVLTENITLFGGMEIISKSGKTKIKTPPNSFIQFTLINRYPSNSPTILKGITFTEFQNTPILITESGIKLEIQSCSFLNNVILDAKNQVGAIDSERASAISAGVTPLSGNTLNIINSSFDSNIGSGVGCINSKNIALTINKSSFKDNRAKSYLVEGGQIPATYAYGGALYLGNGSASIDNTLFEGNTADLQGGAIYTNSFGTLNLKSDTIRGNESIEGGGVYAKGGSIVSTTSLFENNKATSGQGGAICHVNGNTTTCKTTTFKKNTAATNGGTISQVFGSLFLNKVVILESQATNNGGAIYQEQGHGSEIVRSYITQCSANIGGVAYYNGNASFNLTIENNTLTQNGNITPPTQGGVFFIRTTGTEGQSTGTSARQFKFNTITNNNATGSIIEIEGVNNFSFITNIIENTSVDIKSDRPTSFIGGNLIQEINVASSTSTASDFLGANFPTEGAGLETTVQLKNDTYVLPLKCGAKALNIYENPAGSTLELPSTDQSGNSRLVFGKYDAGAYEAPNTSMTLGEYNETRKFTQNSDTLITKFSLSNDCFSSNIKKITLYVRAESNPPTPVSFFETGSLNFTGGTVKNTPLLYTGDLTQAEAINFMLNTLKIKKQSNRQGVEVNFILEDAGGDEVSGYVQIQYPQLPQIENISPSEQGINDTLLIVGSGLADVTKVKFTEIPTSGNRPEQAAKSLVALHNFEVTNIIRFTTDANKIALIVPAENRKPNGYNLTLISKFEDESASTSFNIALPQITSNGLSGYIGDTVRVESIHSGLTNIVKVGSIQLPNDQFAFGTKNGWFIMPANAQGQKLTISNAAGVSTPSPNIQIQADVIEKDTIYQQNICVGTPVKIHFTPKGTFTGSKNVDVMAQKFGGQPITLFQNHTIQTLNQEDSIEVTFDQKYDYFYLKFGTSPSVDSTKSYSLSQNNLQGKPKVQANNISSKICEGNTAYFEVMEANAQQTDSIRWTIPTVIDTLIKEQIFSSAPFQRKINTAGTYALSATMYGSCGSGTLDTSFIVLGTPIKPTNTTITRNKNKLCVQTGTTSVAEVKFTLNNYLGNDVIFWKIITNKGATEFINNLDTNVITHNFTSSTDDSVIVKAYVRNICDTTLVAQDTLPIYIKNDAYKFSVIDTVCAGTAKRIKIEPSSLTGTDIIDLNPYSILYKMNNEISSSQVVGINSLFQIITVNKKDSVFIEEVSDKNGCVTKLPQELLTNAIQPIYNDSTPIIKIDTIEHESCKGYEDGLLKFSTNGNHNYNLTNNNGYNKSGNTSTGSVSLSDLKHGNYTLTLSKNGACAVTKDIEIKEGNEAIDFTLNVPLESEYCLNQLSKFKANYDKNTKPTIAWIGKFGDPINYTDSLEYKLTQLIDTLKIDASPTVGCFKKSTYKFEYTIKAQPSISIKGVDVTDVICSPTDSFNLKFNLGNNFATTVHYSYGSHIKDTLLTTAGDFNLAFPQVSSPGTVPSFKIDSAISNIGCKATAFNINTNLQEIESTNLTVDITGESCIDKNDGKAQINITKGHNITWYNSSNDTIHQTTSGPNGESGIENLVPGSYKVNITDKSGNCSTDKNFTIDKVTGEKTSFIIINKQLCEKKKHTFSIDKLTGSRSNITTINWTLNGQSINKSTTSTDTSSREIEITKVLNGAKLKVDIVVNECNTTNIYSDSVNLNIFLKPNVTITADQSQLINACKPNNFTTKYKTTPTNGVISYIFKDNQDVNTLKTITLNGEEEFTITTPFATGQQKIYLDSVDYGTCKYNLEGDTLSVLRGYEKPSFTVFKIKDESCKGKKDGSLRIDTDKNAITTWFTPLNDELTGDTIRDLTPGIYNVVVKTGNGTCVSDTTKAEIKSGAILDSVSFTLNGDTNVCANKNTQLSVNKVKGSGSFSWTYNGTSKGTNLDSTYVLNEPLSNNPTSNGNIYTVSMSNNSQCPANQQFELTGSFKTLTLPNKAIITGQGTPSCKTDQSYLVINKTPTDSIIWLYDNLLNATAYKDSLIVNSIDRVVILQARLQSEQGCLGTFSNNFEITPSNCPLKAAISIASEQGNVIDTICQNQLFKAKNISGGDYDKDKVKWFLNNVEVSSSSTDLDSLVYDFSTAKSGVYSLKMVVENSNFKDSISFSNAFVVFDTLPNQTISGKDYICYDVANVYSFDMSNVALKKSTWSTTTGSLTNTTKDSVSLSLTGASGTLTLNVISKCNETQTYTKQVKHFGENLSVLSDANICGDTAKIKRPISLQKDSYQLSFVNNGGARPLSIGDTLYQFTKAGFYRTELFDTTSKCTGIDTVKIAIIPGFELHDDIKYITEDSAIITIDIQIDNNDIKYIDSAEYKIINVHGFRDGGAFSTFANVSLDTVARILKYNVINNLQPEMVDGRDSLRYVGQNETCKSLDTAIVYINIPKAKNDSLELSSLDIKTFNLEWEQLLTNDIGGLDTIIFNVDTTYSNNGAVDSNGRVSYATKGFPTNRTEDTVYYQSCAKDNTPLGYNPQSCVNSRLVLRLPIIDAIIKATGSGKENKKDDYELEAYNIVTPNGDGIHDFFEIKLWVKETATEPRKEFNYDGNGASTLQIFTKWGDLVYESENYTFNNNNQRFTGTNTDGSLLPNGTYYYVYDLAVGKCEDCKALDFSKKNFNASGFLILKRDE